MWYYEVKVLGQWRECTSSDKPRVRDGKLMSDMHEQWPIRRVIEVPLHHRHLRLVEKRAIADKHFGG